MQNHRSHDFRPTSTPWLLAAACAAALSACGGGGEATDPASGTAGSATVAAAPSLSFDLAPATASAASAADGIAQPAFHVAPVLLDAPDESDAIDNRASARAEPHVQAIPADMANLSTRRLTAQAMTSARRERALGVNSASPAGSLAPLAASNSVSTYTPAQIRAAYGLPDLPATGLAPTAAQAAQMGAGQTIYIVDAMHDPNAASELAVFNQKFGLAPCTTKAIAANATLPLPAADVGAGCTLSVVYGTAAGTMSGTAPGYDAGWATEIALDVQWAHATAPLARIILIEAPDASLSGLLGSINLANAMGPGIVSMSFGGAEGNWTASADSAFAAAGMTYLAATGDSGAGVPWPAVSPNVVAVGGTRLSYAAGSVRSEVAWTGTGGGISQYTPTPSYQANTVPGIGVLAHRAVADVAFNADPTTGQFIAVIQSGSTAANWLSVGGTSLSTPQWAGLVAVANAIRAQAGKASLGRPHAVLYGKIASVPGTYAGAFADVTVGSDGSCASCSAKVGYDPLTGLGTPNAAGLLSALAASDATVAAPVVGSATISGKAGEPLSFTVSLAASNPVSYSLGGAPAGMSISAAGVVSWPKPVAGTYALTVTARDSKTGLSGKGVYTVTIAKAQPPVITGSALSGVVGKALSGSIGFSDPENSSLTITVDGVPAGMTLAPSKQSLVITWAKPVLGNYTLKVTAKNGAGLSASLAVPIKISAK